MSKRHRKPYHQKAHGPAQPRVDYQPIERVSPEETLKRAVTVLEKVLEMAKAGNLRQLAVFWMDGVDDGMRAELLSSGDPTHARTLRGALIAASNSVQAALHAQPVAASPGEHGTH